MCLKQENDNCKHSNGLLMPDNKVSDERQRKGGTKHEEKNMLGGYVANSCHHDGFCHER